MATTNKLKIKIRCYYCGNKSDEVKFIEDEHGIKRRTCPDCEDYR